MWPHISLLSSAATAKPFKSQNRDTHPFCRSAWGLAHRMKALLVPQGKAETVIRTHYPLPSDCNASGRFVIPMEALAGLATIEFEVRTIYRKDAVHGVRLGVQGVAAVPNLNTNLPASSILIPAWVKAPITC